MKRFILTACVVLSAASIAFAQGLELKKKGTADVYWTHNGKPLLSFGGLSDFIFYAADDAFDYKQWADWAQAHGISHVRAYPPWSWRTIEKFAIENGGAIQNARFPYKETSTGSRQFDLNQFDSAYWTRFRQQCQYLESKGVIIHLLMTNGWQMRNDNDNWGGHFFNPANNINSFTDHLSSDRLRIYHSVADGQTGLANAQKAWFRKLVEETHDLNNVYYDLVHEIAENHSTWSKCRQWIDAMASEVRTRYGQLQSSRTPILGMDTGGLSSSERDWIFTRSYFDILVYGKVHNRNNALNWRTQYRKPYIPQESWDDNGTKWGYRHPEWRANIRKYMWKFMMARCQQMDLYIKPRPGGSNLPGYPHNYNPNGWNPFEDDARVLRDFWNSLTDYPNLKVAGSISSGPGSHKYVLSSGKEAIAYASSPTGQQNVGYGSQTLSLTGLALADGSYKADIVRPDTGVVNSPSVTVAGGKATIALPSFTDDIVVHLTPSSSTSNAPPTVTLTSPTAATSFTAPANITLNANAADSDGTILRVDFYVDGSLIGGDTTMPYNYTWNNVVSGSYTLTAKATDEDGAVTTSSPVNITVSSAPSPSPGLVSGLTVGSGLPYEWTSIGGGTAMYIDRAYTYQAPIPTVLDGEVALRTANDDKFSDSSVPDFITFTVTQDATVYVLYTTVNTTLESTWLASANGWSPESFTVTTSLGGSEADRLVRSRVYSSGSLVELGGNGSTSGTSSMYTVVVVPATGGGGPIDTDGDGLTDNDEVSIYGTNPQVADTDGDGADDGTEVAQGTDPLDPLSYPTGTPSGGGKSGSNGCGATGAEILLLLVLLRKKRAL